MKFKIAATVVILSSFLVLHNANAGWKDLLNSVIGSDKTKQAAKAVLGNDEITAGLKEALMKGASSAVGALGKAGGFLDNPDVKIPLPGKLATLERGLRRIGKDKYAHEVVMTMNRAAESAVPLAKDVFVDAIKDMSVEDAKQILGGPNDAATSYLRDTGGTRLAEKMLPIVAQATGNTGVTKAYKNLLSKAGPVAKFVDLDSLDLDKYVTDKALDGVFTMVAAEEAKIRTDPQARSTDLLKKVFGSK